MTKGRADLMYEKFCSELVKLTDEEFKDLLQELLIKYLTTVNSL